MTIGYPKLPNGPSAKGASEVRGLQAGGGEFQVTRRSDVESRLSDDFSRVKQKAGGYITYGYPNGEKQNTYSATTYDPPCVAMIPWLPFNKGATEIVECANIGRGRYAATNGIFPYVQLDMLSLNYIYTDLGLGDVEYNRARDTDVWVMRRKVRTFKFNYYGMPFDVAEIEVGVTMPSYAAANGPVLPVLNPVVAHAGQAKVSGEPTVAQFFASSTLSARVDRMNRPRNDPTINVILPDGAVIQTFLSPASFTSADAEFCQSMPAIATENHAAFFLRERYYWECDRYDDPLPDTTRKLWLVRIAGKDFSLLTAHDLTFLFDGERERSLLDNKTGDPDRFLIAPGEAITTYYDEMVAMQMRVCALPGDVVLLSYFVTTDDDPLPPESASLTEYTGRQFYMRIARVNIASATASISYEEPTQSYDLLSEVSTTILPDYPAEFITQMVHIGDGRVIAKVAGGLQPLKENWDEATQAILRKEPGTEAVRFIHSIDGGVSFSSFSPTGFEGDVQLGRIGDITVHRPRVDDKPAVLIVNAWSESAKTYYSYVSKDEGFTWKRAGKIAKPEKFMRMDGVWRGTGGFGFNTQRGQATFKNLLPPERVKFPDMTIPNRFEVQE
jgi:hypothetical protein